jgi:predicted ribonuclease YlaK
VSRHDLDRLVTTPAYWALQSLNPEIHASVGPLINYEVQARQNAFDRIIDEVQKEIRLWESTLGTLVMADTNVYLHQVEEFNEIPWSTLILTEEAPIHLVIPLLVIDELDVQKRRGQGRVAGPDSESVKTRARKTVSGIYELFSQSLEVGKLLPSASSPAPVTASLLMDDRNHIRFPHADSEFVDRARALMDFTGRTIHVVTSDIGMALRAKTAGLETVVVDNQRD